MNTRILFLGPLTVGVLWAAPTHATVLWACPQPNGSVVYADRAKPGCQPFEAPELSIVPSPPPKTPEETLAARVKRVEELLSRPPEPAPPSPPPPAAAGRTQQEETCDLYLEWLKLNEKTQGGVQPHTFDEHRRWIFLQKTFGTGVIPTCPFPKEP